MRGRKSRSAAPPRNAVCVQPPMVLPALPNTLMPAALCCKPSNPIRCSWRSSCLPAAASGARSRKSPASAVCCTSSTSAMRSRSPACMNCSAPPAGRPACRSTPGSSVVRPASAPISPWPFCAVARSPTRKRNITWNFSPPGRTSPGILKRCWLSTSLRPTAPAATA